MSNPRNAAGREAICRQIAEVADRCGASVRVVKEWPHPPSREAYVRIAYGPVEVGIVVGPTEYHTGYCLPWHMNTLHPNARMTHAFSAAAGAPVNPYHRRKCTACYDTLEHMLEALERTLECIANGTGLEEKTDG